jgi:hypothetical protein
MRDNLLLVVSPDTTVSEHRMLLIRVVALKHLNRSPTTTEAERKRCFGCRFAARLQSGCRWLP